MKHILPLALLTLSCAGQQQQIKDAAEAARAKAEVMTDSKEFVCGELRALPDFDPRITEAKSLCDTAASVQQIFAALAGDECVAPE